MQLLHSLALYAHILIGSAALMLFWIPMTAPKGSLNHIKYGRYYNIAMYSVSFSGAVMALMVLWDPMLIHGERLSDPENAQRFIDSMRVFFGLLLYLSILVYAGLRHGTLALKFKQSSAKLKKPDLLLAHFSLVLGAPVLFYFGREFGQTLPVVFSILGLLSGSSNLKYIFRGSHHPKAWLREHIGALVGTGIGAHTAFIAFGGRNLFQDIGQLQVIFWIAPGIIGSFAIRHYSMKYAPDAA